jgi:hypothetical protein
MSKWKESLNLIIDIALIVAMLVLAYMQKDFWRWVDVLIAIAGGLKALRNRKRINKAMFHSLIGTIIGLIIIVIVVGSLF